MVPAVWELRFAATFLRFLTTPTRGGEGRADQQAHEQERGDRARRSPGSCDGDSAYFFAIRFSETV